MWDDPCIPAKITTLSRNPYTKQFVLRVGEIWYPKVEPRCKTTFAHHSVRVQRWAWQWQTLRVQTQQGIQARRAHLPQHEDNGQSFPPALNSYTMKNQVSMYTLVFLLLHRSCTTTTTQTPHYSHLVIITGTDIPAGFAWVFPQVRVRVREFRPTKKPVPVAGNPWYYHI